MANGIARLLVALQTASGASSGRIGSELVGTADGSAKGLAVAAQNDVLGDAVVGVGLCAVHGGGVGDARGADGARRGGEKDGQRLHGGLFFSGPVFKRRRLLLYPSARARMRFLPDLPLLSHVVAAPRNRGFNKQGNV